MIVKIEQTGKNYSQIFDCDHIDHVEIPPSDIEVTAGDVVLHTTYSVHFFRWGRLIEQLRFDETFKLYILNESGKTVDCIMWSPSPVNKTNETITA